MRTMRRRCRETEVIFALLLLILASVMSVSANGADISGKTTFDGRFNTRCYAWAQDQQKELCEVSFFKLIATPEKYNHRMISVTGFIIKSFGGIVLFPTKERYDADVQIEGIELIGNLHIDKGLVKKINDGFFPVMVTGTFDATYLGADIHRLGAITDVISVTPVIHIPEK